MLGIPCIGLGFLAIWNYHSLRKDRSGNPAPLPHFYSLHSWLGLITMGLALLQVRLSSAAVPIHSTVGTTTFILAIITAIAGITETAFYKLRLVAAVLSMVIRCTTCISAAMERTLLDSWSSLGWGRNISR
jgi:hypothetical protein